MAGPNKSVLVLAIFIVGLRFASYYRHAYCASAPVDQRISQSYFVVLHVQIRTPF